MAENWYKNRRGEWFVIGQFLLLGLIAFGPRNITVCSEFHPFWNLFGIVLMATGALLALAGLLKLGRRNLTPFVCPKAGSVLLEQGAYRLVRHPVYSGILQVSLGWGLWVDGRLTLGFVMLLFALFHMKAQREEKWLVERFPGYVEYRKKVRRFIPFLYHLS